MSSEYGVMRDVLLGSPDEFAWMPGNAVMSAVVRTTLREGIVFDRAAALRGHAEMVDAYRQAGVTIHTTDGHEELPYGVFTRDATVMTPFGVIVGALANPQRRGEWAPALRFYLANDVPIYDVVTAGRFEGGDFQVISPDTVLISYSEGRTQEASARQVAGWLEREGLQVELVEIDDFFVHIDGMMCMVAPKLAAVCVDVADDGLLAWLERKGIEIVPVSYRDTMALGCNVVALGNDRVLSSTASPALNSRLRALGLEVFDPDLSMFQRAGGGPHCLCQPLRRDPV